MPDAPEISYTELAVAMGRLEEGQAHVLEALREMKPLVQQVPVIRREVDELQDWRKTAEARKPPWTAIAAVVLAAFGLVKQYLGF